MGIKPAQQKIDKAVKHMTNYTFHTVRHVAMKTLLNSHNTRHYKCHPRIIMTIVSKPGRVFALYPFKFANVKIAFLLQFLQLNLNVRFFLPERGCSQLQYLVLFVELRN